jgi:hypothetical protein
MHKGAFKSKNDIDKDKKDLYNNIESEETLEGLNITEESEIEINNYVFFIYPIANSAVDELQYIKKRKRMLYMKGKAK